MIDDRFQTRYAIRLPDSRLAINALTDSPYTWDDRDSADRALGYFRSFVERMGVAEWRGQIVQQLCTPWVHESDYLSAQELVDELTAWLERQTGGGAP